MRSKVFTFAVVFLNYGLGLVSLKLGPVVLVEHIANILNNSLLVAGVSCHCSMGALVVGAEVLRLLLIFDQSRDHLSHGARSLSGSWLLHAIVNSDVCVRKSERIRLVFVEGWRLLACQLTVLWDPFLIQVK